VTFPPLRPFGVADLPAPTGSEAAALDRRAIDEVGVPQAVLMENAGRTAAWVARTLAPRGEVVALVGSGNNGGDALVALRTLAEWGRPVRAVLVGDRGADESILHGWELPRIADGDLDGPGWGLLETAGLVVDGMLGTGIQGAPRERQARVIRRLEGISTPILALDIPSGVDADTGAVPGVAVRAAATVAFGWPKLGTLLHPGREWTGRLVTAGIGFPPDDRPRPGAAVLTPGWARGRWPVRGTSTHKNQVGSLLLVAGSPGMAGAAVLAARAALRSGTGLLRVASAEANRTVLQAAVPEAVFIDAGDRGALEEAMEASSAVAVGPGLGTDPGAERILARIVGGPDLPLLVDADGLNLLARGRPTGVAEALGGRPALITPHPGEMARLAEGNDLAEADEGAPSGPVETARNAARRWGCVVVLKGGPTVLAAPGHPVLVDVVGTSDLATGGMGDVLTGVAGSFLAQGCAPRRAAGLALLASGRAAVLARRGPGLLPSDVVEHLPGALAEDGPGTSDLELPGLLFDRDPVR
jgi:NAD(P)H-hydrate epimerase